MSQTMIVRFSLSAVLLGAALLAPVFESVASADNPKTFIAVFPAEITLQADKGLKRVRFQAEVTSDHVGVDVISITAATSFNIQALAKCTGEDNVTINENGDSPLSPADDAIYDCPFFSRGEAIQGGLGIN